MICFSVSVCLCSRMHILVLLGDKTLNLHLWAHKLLSYYWVLWSPSLDYKLCHKLLQI